MPGDLVNDAGGNRVEDVVGDRLDRGGHRVAGVDRADDGESRKGTFSRIRQEC